MWERERVQKEEVQAEWSSAVAPGLGAVGLCVLCCVLYEVVCLFWKTISFALSGWSEKSRSAQAA